MRRDATRRDRDGSFVRGMIYRRVKIHDARRGAARRGAARRYIDENREKGMPMQVELRLTRALNERGEDVGKRESNVVN